MLMTLFFLAFFSSIGAYGLRQLKEEDIYDTSESDSVEVIRFFN